MVDKTADIFSLHACPVPIIIGTGRNSAQNVAIAAEDFPSTGKRYLKRLLNSTGHPDPALLAEVLTNASRRREKDLHQVSQLFNKCCLPFSLPLIGEEYGQGMKTSKHYVRI